MNLLASLEALLFIYGEPMTSKKIASLLEIKEEEVLSLGETLKKNLSDDENRGLSILSDGLNWQLVTKPELKSVVEKIIKSETREDISQASQETLAIIAYIGPVEQTKIDYIRGVNSSFTLRNLLVRGLIEKSGHAYKLSFAALRHLGIDKLEDLPEFGKYHKALPN